MNLLDLMQQNSSEGEYVKMDRANTSPTPVDSRENYLHYLKLIDWLDIVYDCDDRNILSGHFVRAFK